MDLKNGKVWATITIPWHLSHLDDFYTANRIKMIRTWYLWDLGALNAVARRCEERD